MLAGCGGGTDIAGARGDALAGEGLLLLLLLERPKEATAVAAQEGAKIHQLHLVSIDRFLKALIMLLMKDPPADLVLSMVLDGKPGVLDLN